MHLLKLAAILALSAIVNAQTEEEAPTCTNEGIVSNEEADCSAIQEIYCDPAYDRTPTPDVVTKHTLCEYCGVYTETCGQVCRRGPVTEQSDINLILKKHNKLRAEVALGNELRGNPGPQPEAANMRALVWDPELAEIAQQWADTCQEGIEKNGIIFMDDYGKSGKMMNSEQNVDVTVKSENKLDNGIVRRQIERWYDEVENWPADLTSSWVAKTGNDTRSYTAMIWAETSRVGCGFIKSLQGDDMYVETFVCNYARNGNRKGNPVYIVGEAGSQCPEGTTYNGNGLCEQDV